MVTVKGIKESVTPTGKVEEESSVATEDAPSLSKKERSKALIAKFVKEERKLVKGRFRCHETPGATVRIQIRKYAELPMFDLSMTDGEVYDIPLYVARHLNGVDITAAAIDGKIGSCSYPVHGFRWEKGAPMPGSDMGMGGVPIPLIGVTKRVRRYGFESMEFDVA